MLDEVFGRESFMNEIVWAYDYGARSKRRWSPKHDSLLWYVNDPGRYTFNYDAIDRIPYMAPGLVGPKKGGARQDPDGCLVAHHREPQRGGRRPATRPRSRSGSWSASSGCTRSRVTGSSTSSRARARSGRRRPATGRGFVLVDDNPEAVRVMLKRLAEYAPELESQREFPNEESGEPRRTLPGGGGFPASLAGRW